MQVIHTKCDQAAVAGYIWYNMTDIIIGLNLEHVDPLLLSNKLNLCFLKSFSYDLSKVQTVP
jgi:hypothetical protein